MLTGIGCDGSNRDREVLGLDSVTLGDRRPQDHCRIFRSSRRTADLHGLSSVLDTSLENSSRGTCIDDFPGDLRSVLTNGRNREVRPHVVRVVDSESLGVELNLGCIRKFRRDLDLMALRRCLATQRDCRREGDSRGTLIGRGADDSAIRSDDVGVRRRPGHLPVLRRQRDLGCLHIRRKGDPFQTLECGSLDLVSVQKPIGLGDGHDLLRRDRLIPDTEVGDCTCEQLIGPRRTTNRVQRLVADVLDALGAEATFRNELAIHVELAHDRAAVTVDDSCD